MKHKKLLAIALCIGIVSTSFSGFISYAENIAANKRGADESAGKAPAPGISELKAEVNRTEITYEDHGKAIQTGDSVVIYQSTRTTVDPDRKVNDRYNFDEQAIEELMNKGYSLQDIFEADEIGNEIQEDPFVLLEKKETSEKSLTEIKEDILKDRKEKANSHLKKKYSKEFDQLTKDKMKEEEIVSFLAYIDMSGQKLTNDLVKEYRKKGTELFKEIKLQDNDSKNKDQ